MLEKRAAGALNEILDQVSAVKVREIRPTPHTPGHSLALLASIEVLGQPHMLACTIVSGATPSRIEESLSELRRGVPADAENATPVLIAPRIPHSVQPKYQSARVGYLDFHGNARIELGEVFILKRSLPLRPPQASAVLGS